MRVPKTGALIFTFASFLGLCTRFFVTLDKLRPLGIAQKINFVSFLWLSPRFFVTLQM